MNIGIYQSAASLSALEKWQDAVTQNITSAQVAGFRQRMVAFSSQSNGSWQVGSGNDPDQTVAALFPTTVSGINYQNGNTEHTGRSLDLAIQGEGWFELQMPDGSRAYTRDGEFSIAADRTLVTAAGAQVLSSTGSPITLLPSGGNIVVNPDGTIIQGDAQIGKVGVKGFSDNKQLVPIGTGLFAAGDNARPTPVVQPEVLQGYHEASNVSPMREMVDLVTISRSYEANQKVITSADQRAQKALDALG